MALVRDQLQRSVTVPDKPYRIVSLCPSITETLFEIGVGDSVVGRTSFCRYPNKSVASLLDVGGTNDPCMDTIRSLEPDLVIAVREENPEGIVRSLAEHMPVVVLDPVSVSSALDAIELLGVVTSARSAAEDLVSQISSRFNKLPRVEAVPVVYLVWQDPFIAVGQGTYIDDILNHLGFTNAARVIGGRYPTVDESTLAELNPKLLLASSEPYSFEEHHLPGLREIVPSAEPVLVDGEMFGWYGARMLAAADYFAKLVPQLAGKTGYPER